MRVVIVDLRTIFRAKTPSLLFHLVKSNKSLEHKTGHLLKIDETMRQRSIPMIVQRFWCISLNFRIIACKTLFMTRSSNRFMNSCELIKQVSFSNSRPLPRRAHTDSNRFLTTSFRWYPFPRNAREESWKLAWHPIFWHQNGPINSRNWLFFPAALQFGHRHWSFNHHIVINYLIQHSSGCS